MNLLKDRRLILAGGAGLALVAGLGIAYLFIKHDKAPDQPPPASQGGLVVQTGRDDDLKLDPKRPLRCFVDGQFVGELPLALCARRNGVATGALDVGLDPSGALAASNGVVADITPLPPPAAAPAQPATVTELTPEGQGAAPAAEASSPPAGAPGGDCWRYAAGEWRETPTPETLNACVQNLFAGHCERGGSATYGRWADQTLRLTNGRVEISADSREFRPLVDPWPGCDGAG